MTSGAVVETLQFAVAAFRLKLAKPFFGLLETAWSAAAVDADEQKLREDADGRLCCPFHVRKAFAEVRREADQYSCQRWQAELE